MEVQEGKTQCIGGCSVAVRLYAVQKQIELSVMEPKLTCAGYIDYGSSLVHWMRNRRPGQKGFGALEAERPSGSYIVDVRLLKVPINPTVGAKC